MGEVAVNGRGPVMAGDPIEEVMLNGTVSESKENVEGFINGAVELTERVKRRAKRPSKFMTKELSRANSDTQVIAPLRALKNSRKSRNGFGRGLPKKGGAGGKGTWGALGSELAEEEVDGAIDSNDPNYDEANPENREFKIKVIDLDRSNEELQVDCEHAVVTLARSDSLLSMRHGLVRLDNVWGVGGGTRPVKYLVKQMVLLLEEYLSSSDINEATRCLQELEVPHFHHELVYEAVVMAIEKMDTRTSKMMIELLGSLHRAIIITPTQMRAGFVRVGVHMSRGMSLGLGTPCCGGVEWEGGMQAQETGLSEQFCQAEPD